MAQPTDIQLLCGDCLNLMKDIPDNSIDMILCDLPYGTTRCKWDSIIPFDELWGGYKRVIKDNGAIVLFGAEPFTSFLITSNPKMFRYDLIWVKPQGTDFLNANRKPLRRHENICVFYKKQPKYNKQMRPGKSGWRNRSKTKTECYANVPAVPWYSDGPRNPTTILEFGVERGYHTSQKPVPLLEWLIKTYTDEGEVVLDNCMGSGSTGVACVNTNRKFIGIELNQEYFDVASKRINEALNSSEKRS